MSSTASIIGPELFLESFSAGPVRRPPISAPLPGNALSPAYAAARIASAARFVSEGCNPNSLPGICESASIRPCISEDLLYTFISSNEQQALSYI
jgi:hypothetical protein